MARRRFIADELAPDRAVVRGAGARHLARVLRVQPGQVYEVSDGRRVFLGRVLSADAAAVVFALEQEIPVPKLSPVILLPSIFKFDRYEWMIEKATELGVARLIPVVAERTDRRLAEAARKRVERWRRLAFEAAQQCRRLGPPEVTEPQSLLDALVHAGQGPRWMLDEDQAGQPTGELLEPAAPGSGGPALLTGPEGGFTKAERAAALEQRFAPVSLGPLVLRAETAALAALAIVQYGQVRRAIPENEASAKARIIE
jgi:16S rRNA (uracil1498-N3)-methyltransferase